jgi:hypothetical protein
MAQPPKQGIPPNPNHPHGTNIHGQPNPPPDQGTPDPKQPQPASVNIHGRPPESNMAPPADTPKGVGDNTRAEMDAGKKNLDQYKKRDDAEHEAGRHEVESRSNPRG